MAQLFEVHPQQPQVRLLKQAADCLHRGGVVAVPTDSSYALVCHLDDKAAVDKLRRIRGVDERHHLTLLCRDLSELANYARVDNRQYRLLKLGTPGPTPSYWRQPKRCRVGFLTPLGEPSACAFRTTPSRKPCWTSWVSRCWLPP